MSHEILLVDDDPLIRTVVSDNLSDDGFAVHVASDEKRALEALRAHPGIAVALVDYCLPRPVGIQLCRRIAADFPNIAVALYTGHGELANVRLQGERFTVLSKMMRMDQLATALHEIAEGRIPQIDPTDLSSRAEDLWKRETKRETVWAVSRAMHSQFDRSLQEPLPSQFSATVMRLPGEENR